MKGSRRRSREYAMRGLYQWLVTGGDIGAIRVQMMDADDFRDVEVVYFGELLTGAAEAAEDSRKLFVPHLSRELSSVSPVEHAILLLGTFELASRPDVPRAVVVNEAVELAKRYGGNEGHKFVNGVLDRLAHDLRPAEMARGRR